MLMSLPFPSLTTITLYLFPSLTIALYHSLSFSIIFYHDIIFIIIKPAYTLTDSLSLDKGNRIITPATRRKTTLLFLTFPSLKINFEIYQIPPPHQQR